MPETEPGVTPRRCGRSLVETPASAGAALQRVDRLRVVLDRLGRAPRVGGGHQTLTSSPVRNMTAEAGQQARRPRPDRACGRQGRCSDGASCTITWTIAPAPKPNRNAARLALKAAEPIQAPRTAGAPGDQAERGEPADATGARAPAARRSRGPRSCCGSRSRRRGTRRARAPDRVRGSDRNALTEVVQPDPGRDEQRQRPAGDAGRAAPSAAACVEPGRHAAEQQVGDGRAEHDERRAAERLRAGSGEVEALERRVDRKEPEQPDGERHDPAQPVGRDAPDPREPEHPERDRDHPDVDAEQRHQPEEREVARRGLDGDRDLVGDRATRRGQQDDLVGLALDPRLA